MLRADLVEVLNAQNGKGLAIKATFSRENNTPGAHSCRCVPNGLTGFKTAPCKLWLLKLCS